MNILQLPFYIRGYVISRRLSHLPIIVGGCERSGTTLFQAILSAHPRIFAIKDEVWSFCYGPYSGFEGNKPIRLARLYKHLGKYAKQQNNAWRWSEKTPANIFYFDEILKHFQNNIKLIQIVRDGRDVVSSKHPKDSSKPWVPIKRWVDAVNVGLKYKDNSHVLTIRYEDLIQDYETTIENVCNFIGEELVDELRNWHSHRAIDSSTNLISEKIAKIHPNSIRKFESANFKYKEIVEQLEGNAAASRLLKLYGYQ